MSTMTLGGLAVTHQPLGHGVGWGEGMGGVELQYPVSWDQSPGAFFAVEDWSVSMPTTE